MSKEYVAKCCKSLAVAGAVVGSAALLLPLASLKYKELPAVSLYLWNLLVGHLPAGSPDELLKPLDECVGGTRPVLGMLILTALLAILAPVGGWFKKGKQIREQMQMGGAGMSAVLLLLMIGQFWNVKLSAVSLTAGFTVSLVAFSVATMAALTVFLLEFPREDPTHPAYRVGTLKYTTLQMMVVCAWMIWGDFVFNFMEGVFPTLMPIQLRNSGSSAMTISVFMRTIPAIMGLVLVPIISFHSDRCRSSWGRRKPYIIFTAPFLVLFLGSLGHIEDIAHYLDTHEEVCNAWGLSASTAILLVIGVLVIGFQFFNDFVASVYYYLYNDVIPREVMGRFLGFSRVKGAVAGFMWGNFIFPHVGPYTKHIYWGMALLYLFGFSLMMWQVKEGDYAAVDDAPAQPAGPRRSLSQRVWDRIKGFARGTKLFFVECFASHPMYMMIFLATAATYTADAASQFNILFMTETVGLSYAEMGRIGGYWAMISLVLSLPLGWVVDRFTPMRVFIICALLSIPASIGRAVVWDYYSSLVITLIANLDMSLKGAAEQPMMMQLLPREKYGQFSAANTVFRNIASVVMPLAGAAFVIWLATPMAVIKPGEAARVYNEGKTWHINPIAKGELDEAVAGQTNQDTAVAEKAGEKFKKLKVYEAEDVNLTASSKTLVQLDTRQRDCVITLPGSEAPRNHVVTNLGQKPIVIKEANWRSFYLWKIPWLVVVAILWVIVYRYFVKLGGHEKYQPPGSTPAPPAAPETPVLVEDGKPVAAPAPESPEPQKK